MLSGIRFIKLKISTDKDLSETRDFIAKLSTYLNKKSKLEILSGCCKLIGDILVPLSDVPDVQGINYGEFRNMVTDFHYDTKKYWKKVKEPISGFTMETGILCSGKKEFFAQQPFSVFEKLSKNIKIVDKNRPIILDCTYYLLMNLFLKYDNANYDIGFDLILEKLSREMFPSPSKKAVIPQFESVEVFVDIASLVSVYRLDYSLNNFVLQAVNASDSNYERIVIGLKTFNAIADRLGISYDKTLLRFILDNEHSIRNQSYRKESLYRRIETTHSRSNMSEEALQSFRKSLEQLICFLDLQVGEMLLWNSNLKSINQETQSLFSLLSESISCIRRVPPSNFTPSKLFSLISKYSMHIDEQVRREAQQLLIGILTSRESIRGTLIEEYTKFLLSIPDGATQYIIKSANFLLELLNTWYDPVVIHTVEVDTECMDLSQAKQRFPSFILEAAGLILLCSNFVSVRTIGLEILQTTRRANEGLPREVSEMVPSIMMVIDSNSDLILQNMCFDLTEVSRLSSSFLLKKNEKNYTGWKVEDYLKGNVSSDELQLDWTRCLGEIMRTISKNCSNSTTVAYSLIYDRIESKTNLLLTSKRVDPGFMEHLIQWRNFCVILFGSGEGDPLYAKTSEFSIEHLLKKLIFSTFNSPHQIMKDSIHLALQYYSKAQLIVFLDYLQSIDPKKRKDVKDVKDHNLRIELANVYRTIADKLDYSLVQDNPKNFMILIEFIADTIAFIDHLPDGIQHQFQSVVYNLFKTSAFILELLLKKNRNAKASVEFSKDLREVLFNFAMRRVGFGPFRAEYKAKESKIKELFIAQLKDEKLKDEKEKELKIQQFDQLCDTAQYWAIRLLNSILLEPSHTLHAEIFSENGPIFLFSTEIFERSVDEEILQLGSDILKGLIRSNPDQQESMFSKCVDKSFVLSAQRVSEGFFYTVVDIITSGADISCKLPMLLNLAIYKLSDTNEKVRNSAVKLLHWLSVRFFRTAEITYQLPRRSHLLEVSKKKLYNISKAFAEKHPELRSDILEEIVTRMPHVDRESQRLMIYYITAWFSNVNLDDFDEEILLEILKHFIVFTSKYAEQRGDLIENLWVHLVEEIDNVPILLNALRELILSMQHRALIFEFRRIAIYLFRVVPKEFIKFFISELKSTKEIEVYHSNKPSNSPWGFDTLFSPQDAKSPISRRSLTLILFSDLIGENHNVFQPYLATILHAAIIEIDSGNNLVRNAAITNLENLIFMNVVNNAKELSPHTKFLRDFTAEIDKQSTDNYLWKYESVSLQQLSIPSQSTLFDIIQLILQSLSFLNQLDKEWAVECMRWLELPMEDHFICRTLQIFRSLKPTFNPSFLHTLIAKLYLSIQNRTSANICVTLEIIETLKVTTKNTPKDILYSLPELFWTCTSLLNTPLEIEFNCVTDLLSNIIDQMDINHPTTQENLLKSLPSKWNPPFQGIINYLLKGICNPLTEINSRNLLTKLTSCTCSSLLHTDLTLQPLAGIIGLLPYLLTAMGRDDSIFIACTISEGFYQLNNEEFGEVFKSYQNFTSSVEGIRRFLHEVASLIVKNYFPKYEVYVFTFLIENLVYGCKQERAILMLMEALIQSMDFKTSSIATIHSSLFGPVTKYLSTPLWREVNKLVEIVLEKSEKNDQNKKLAADFTSIQKVQFTISTWEKSINYTPLLLSVQETITKVAPQHPLLRTHSSPVLSPSNPLLRSNSSNLSSSQSPPSVHRKIERNDSEEEQRKWNSQPRNTPSLRGSRGNINFSMGSNRSSSLDGKSPPVPSHPKPDSDAND